MLRATDRRVFWPFIRVEVMNALRGKDVQLARRLPEETAYVVNVRRYVEAPGDGQT
jgi:hypothetical protein